MATANARPASGASFDAADALDHGVLDGAGHLVVAQHVGGAGQRGRVLGDDGGVARGHQPLGRPPRHVRRPQPFDDGVAGQEVLLHERAERTAELVLAGGDQGGVRDGQPERMAEQGGDREPVGQAPDHGGLGGGPEVTPTVVHVGLRPAGDDEHRRRAQQQTGGAALHAPQIAPARRLVAVQDQLSHRRVCTLPATDRVNRPAQGPGGR
ncbi:MAG: hypothetical protein R2749_11745 [Acidimicrobiales bacterium]